MNKRAVLQYILKAYFLVVILLSQLPLFLLINFISTKPSQYAEENAGRW